MPNHNTSTSAAFRMGTTATSVRSSTSASTVDGCWMDGWGLCGLSNPLHTHLTRPLWSPLTVFKLCRGMKTNFPQHLLTSDMEDPPDLALYGSRAQEEADTEMSSILARAVASIELQSMFPLIFNSNKQKNISECKCKNGKVWNSKSVKFQLQVTADWLLHII